MNEHEAHKNPDLDPEELLTQLQAIIAWLEDTKPMRQDFDTAADYRAAEALYWEAWLTADLRVGFAGQEVRAERRKAGLGVWEVFAFTGKEARPAA